MITLTINGKQVEVKEGATLLEAAQEAGVYIPTLCYHPALRSDGSCELCLVEVEGRQDFPLACVTPVTEGMVVHTDAPQVRELQRSALRRILAHHPCACLVCWRRERCDPFDICLRNVAVSERCVVCPENDHCELQMVVEYIGLGEEFSYSFRDLPVYRDNPLFERNYNYCISCSRCVRMCEEVRGIGAITMVEHDGERLPQPSDGKSLISSGCRFCSACVEVCPTGALVDTDGIWRPELPREAVVTPCSYACPGHVDVPLYVYLIGQGRFAEALAVIREKVPFPATLGRVCIHPCEEACRRGRLSECISIKFLKRFAAEHDDKQWKKYSFSLPPTGKSVAVVGSGPAGLTAAYYLAKLGHSVTMFEALPEPGGMMRVAIPEYRLPRDILAAEIDEIKSVGVDIKTNTRIESVDALFEQGYQAVFLALGAHQGTRMRVEGEDTPGVLDAVTFLREVSLGKKVNLGDKVAVIGGGNAAIDSARVALRLGSKEVTILYRRTRVEMPASPEEVEAAIEEGVNIIFLVAPVKISKKDARLELVCQRMELGEPDASGRRRPVPIKGSEFSTEFDSIVAAIGQASDIPKQFNLKITAGNIQVDPDTLATSREGVFAGGDVVSGPASVIEAIAAGRKAASSIDRYLGGRGVIDEVLTEERQYNLCVGKEEGFIDRARVKMPSLTAEERIKNFDEVELGFDRGLAVTEAKRCFQCGVRFQVPSAPLPPVPVKIV